MINAFSEAKKCLLCYDPPCSKDCPANTNPGKFIRQIFFQNIKGAARTIKNNNVLGLACGYLCPSEILCEKNCILNNQIDIKQHIDIKYVQKEIMEYYYENKFDAIDKQKNVNKKKCAVIGGGPAGLSCAYELAKNGHSVDIYEKRKEIGGVLRYGVPENRYAREKLEDELDDLKKLEVNIFNNYDFKGNKQETETFLKKYRAIFISVGLWKPRKLFDDDSLYRNTGIFNSIDFLKKAKENNLDVRMILDKNIAIIGGGSVAIDCATVAKDLGAKNSTIIYRRNFEKMPGEKSEIFDALEHNIDILWKSLPISYDIGKNNKVHRIRLVKTEVAGKCVTIKEKENSWGFDADIVVEAIGNIASFELNEEIEKEINKRIFIGGDFSTGAGLIVHAIRDGKAAAKKMAEV
jgi:NADPH-dependent glutamate synthase beta subunit-like oxidoreductase